MNLCCSAIPHLSVPSHVQSTNGGLTIMQVDLLFLCKHGHVIRVVLGVGQVVRVVQLRKPCRAPELLGFPLVVPNLAHTCVTLRSATSTLNKRQRRCIRYVSTIRKGISPILVMENRPRHVMSVSRRVGQGGQLLTSFNLLADFHPEILGVLVVHVDETREEEHECCSPEDH